MVLSGQVSASDEAFFGVEGMPKETKLSESILSLPPTVHGMTMSATSDVGPVMETGQVVKCCVKRGQGKWFSFQETFPVVDSNGEPFAGGLHIKEFKKLAGIAYSRFVMYDSNGEPVCVAKHDGGKLLQRVYYINHTKPLLDGDTPNDKEGDVDLYPWFKIHDIDDSHLTFRSLLVWNGSNYQPMMRIKPVMRKADQKNIGELLPPLKADNVVVDSSDENKVYALLSRKKTDTASGWHLCAAPGTDVIAMIMVATMMDDMVGVFA